MSRIQELIKEKCPNGVVLKKIKDISKVTIGEFVHKNSQSESGKYPVYNGGITNTGYYDKYNNGGKKVIISARGANAGYVNRVNEKYWAGNSCYTLTIINESYINWNYLYHYLKNNEKILLGVQQTGSIPAISKKQVENFKIPVPPIEVQEEIVRILDKFGKLEAELEAELEARKQQYEFWREKLLTSTNKYKLGDIAKFTYGFTDKALDFGDARYIRITDITEDGKLSNNDCKYLNITNANSKYVLNKGDIVVARTGASFGKTLYFNGDFPSIYASFLIKIELDNEIILNRYYWHFSKSSLYWNQANNLVSKAGQPQFNSNAIKKIEIPIPSLEEQKRIINILDKFDKLVNDISEGLPAEIGLRKKQYEYYRNKLLSFEELS